MCWNPDPGVILYCLVKEGERRHSPESCSGLPGRIGIGFLLDFFFKKVYIRDTQKAILLISIAVLLTAAETSLGSKVPFSGLLAILVIGVVMLEKYEPLAACVAAGEVILAVAVLSNIVTAPLGDWAMKVAENRWLAKENIAPDDERDLQ